VYLREAFMPTMDDDIALLAQVRGHVLAACLLCSHFGSNYNTCIDCIILFVRHAGADCLQAYGLDGKLYVNYALMPAWG
jgi:hypothetical protein